MATLELGVCKLRILLASDHYPPFIGGAHRQIQLLGRELHRRGHEVRVATVWHGGLSEREDDGDVPVYRFKQLRTWRPWLVRDHRQRHQPPFPDPITVAGLRHLIDAFNPDLVHSYGWFSYSCAVALLRKNIPLLISVRDYAYSCANRMLLYRGRPCDGPSFGKCLECAADYYGVIKGWLSVAGVFWGRHILVRQVEGVHSISTWVHQIIQRDFWNDRASRTVAQAVIPSFREDDRNEAYSAKPEVASYLRFLPQEPFILFVGALRLAKGLRQLVTAYERLAAPPPLVLIGTIERDTPHEFPPGVVVLENFPHAAVMAAWERCLFGVVPSLWPEPLGSVVHEAMSRGKAVISTTPGGPIDMIVNGETGLLVPVGDIAALTKAIKTLIQQHDLREQFGQAGRERAMLFTAESALPRFEQLYQQIVDSSDARGFRKISKSDPVSDERNSETG
jgi:glycosyltransferase involved in cell wall biosynthesis